MKKVFVILFLSVLLPAAAFAQMSIGPAVFLKSPVLVGQEINIDELNVNQFSFGGNARIRVDWFQADALLLYSVGEVDSLDIYLDLGAALDISIVTLSLGAGPNFTANIGDNRAAQAGLNSKLGVDVRLGELMIGSSYIMALDINENRVRIEKSSGLLGMHVLFQM
ncbi:hypothetical protein [Spirochaeta dissipatitropha]